MTTLQHLFKRQDEEFVELEYEEKDYLLNKWLNRENKEN